MPIPTCANLSAVCKYRKKKSGGLCWSPNPCKFRELVFTRREREQEEIRYTHSEKESDNEELF